MSFFEQLKGFGQMFRTLDKEAMKEFGKQTGKFVAKHAAKAHQDKRYKGIVYNSSGAVECELIIIPKSDVYTAALGNIVKEKFELTLGKGLKVEIELLPEYEAN